MTPPQMTSPTSKRCRIVIIAKAPVPGYCKTRLIPALGAAVAAALASAMLRQAVQAAIDADIGPVELCAAPSQLDPAWRGLNLPDALEWSDQGTGDLGQRMSRATQRTLARGEHTVLIGSDCPSLDAMALRGIAQALCSHTSAIVPASDGGYVALGLTKHADELFQNMPWSTSAVAALTLERIAKQGWTVATLATLHDIDDPSDLIHLPSHLASMAK